MKEESTGKSPNGSHFLASLLSSNQSTKSPSQSFNFPPVKTQSHPTPTPHLLQLLPLPLH